MSVYIKGMEMPTSCTVCPMLEGDRLDGLCHAASKWLDDDEHWTWYVYPEGDMDDSKPCNCPLVPVPEHERLLKVLKTERECVSRDCDRNCGKCDLSMERSEILSAYDALIAVLDAPTIIEAEEGE